VSFDRESPDVTLAVDYVVTAADCGSPVALTSSAALRLTVADVDDSAPTFGVGHYEFEVAEDAAAGAHVGSVAATDADGAPFNRVVYRLSTDDDDDAPSTFDVDRHSGHIVTAAALDREQVVKLEFHATRFLVASSQHPRDILADAPDTSDVLARMSVSPGCYDDNPSKTVLRDKFNGTSFPHP